MERWEEESRGGLGKLTCSPAECSSGPVEGAMETESPAVLHSAAADDGGGWAARRRRTTERGRSAEDKEQRSGGLAARSFLLCGGAVEEVAVAGDPLQCGGARRPGRGDGR